MCQTESVDWEVELAVVIGKKCKDVNEEDALDYVLGWTVANDVSPVLSSPFPSFRSQRVSRAEPLLSPSLPPFLFCVHFFWPALPFLDHRPQAPSVQLAMVPRQRLRRLLPARPHPRLLPHHPQPARPQALYPRQRSPEAERIRGRDDLPARKVGRILFFTFPASALCFSLF